MENKMNLLAAHDKNLRLFIHDLRCSGTAEDLKDFHEFLGNPPSLAPSAEFTSKAEWRLGYPAESFVDAVNDVTMTLLEFSHNRPHLWLRVLTSENLPISDAHVAFIAAGLITDTYDLTVRDPSRCDYEAIADVEKKASRSNPKTGKSPTRT
jgi:hypothetical protein